MKTIASIIFGSHLYGTDTATSDIDIKQVFVPGSQDILLQNAIRGTRQGPDKNPGEKNNPGDMDVEAYSLQKYLMLAAKCETGAIEMLFTPHANYEQPPSREWLEIVKNRDKFITRQCAPFVGYCRKQANKYGIRGSRVATVRSALDLLDEAMVLGGHFKLSILSLDIAELIDNNDHMSIVKIELNDGTVIKYWEVCGRKLQFTGSIKNAHSTVKRLFDEYGQRALAAEKNEGIDWKALSHAVRVGYEAIDLLSTGEIKFPLVEANYLLKIKSGLLPYKEVADEIERLIQIVENAAEKSTLPEHPDTEWIDDFLYHCHRKVILES